MGRCDESIRELKLAARLDPLSLVISADLGRAYYYARQYDLAIAQEAKTLEMDSNFWLSRINLGRSYTQIGKHDDAVMELENARRLSSGSTEAEAFLAFAYASAGKHEEARRMLESLHKQAAQIHVPPYHFAVAHAGLGENDSAFQWLERALDKHAVDLFTINVEPMFDTLRADSRFEDLVRRVGLSSSHGAAEPQQQPGT
jgi:serine/threonine-protein kinase